MTRNNRFRERILILIDWIIKVWSLLHHIIRSYISLLSYAFAVVLDHCTCFTGTALVLYRSLFLNIRCWLQCSLRYLLYQCLHMYSLSMWLRSIFWLLLTLVMQLSNFGHILLLYVSWSYKVFKLLIYLLTLPILRSNCSSVILSVFITIPDRIMLCNTLFLHSFFSN